MLLHIYICHAYFNNDDSNVVINLTVLIMCILRIKVNMLIKFIKVKEKVGK